MAKKSAKPAPPEQKDIEAEKRDRTFEDFFRAGSSRSTATPERT
jgi:hypothetical protein